MAKRPAFQYYPGDLRRDTALQSCTFYARSVWREMMDYMHDGEPYGHLTANGDPITPDELARMIGEQPAKVRAAVAELERKKVFSRNDQGVIYSRRMVRDEEVRNKRASGGSKSLNNPNVPRPKGPPEGHGKGYPSDRPLGGPMGDPLHLQSASASASAGKDTDTTTTARAVADDVENFVSLAIRTANGGMSEALPDFQPILPSHSSRQNVHDWLAAGVDRQLILDTVAARAKAASRQISSMKYFDKAIRDAYEKGQAVIHPDSQAGQIKAGGPGAEKPKDHRAKRVGEPPSAESDDAKRVEAWKLEHPAEAKEIWEAIRDDLKSKGADALGLKHFTNAIDAHFRRRILAEHLTPKLAAS